jgi:antitoxin (DNA-binding transcriptional repressor) of toxin-antitoxin stability system
MQVSVSEAAVNLISLVETAINGEEVIILLAGTNRPSIRLMPIESVKPQSIPETQTWHLCGSFTTNHLLDHTEVSTNYAEQIDDVLYRGS